MKKKLKNTITQQEMLRPYLALFSGDAFVPPKELENVINKTYDLLTSSSIKSTEDFVKSLGVPTNLNKMDVNKIRSDEQEKMGLHYINEKEIKIIQLIWKNIANNVILSHSLNGKVSLKLNKLMLIRIYQNEENFNSLIKSVLETINSFFIFEGFDSVITTYEKGLLNITLIIQY